MTHMEHTVEATISEVVDVTDFGDKVQGSVTGEKLYFPVYEYRVDGIDYRTRGRYGTQDKSKYTIGDSEIIGYEPNSPKIIYTQPHEEHEKEHVIGWVVFCVIVVILAVILKCVANYKY